MEQARAVEGEAVERKTEYAGVTILRWFGLSLVGWVVLAGLAVVVWGLLVRLMFWWCS
ncbi:hypothetical protein SAMN05216421_1093 [Halopseudomonas xinjiangensis]|uniref:Uncharacterized protein n=1 Tax=Halopseudomonas xinjiangensis TaxID=487184 RepID=A0A1H1QC49_9GAMM|nr:hypothetical protein SAMN05216421_1093 [Halopseudomonas xinjiangensis]